MKVIKLFYILLPFFLISCTHNNHRPFSNIEEWSALKYEERPRGYWLAGNFIPEQKPGVLNDFFGDKDNLVNMVLVIGAIDKNR